MVCWKLVKKKEGLKVTEIEQSLSGKERFHEGFEMRKERLLGKRLGGEHSQIQCFFETIVQAENL